MHPYERFRQALDDHDRKRLELIHRALCIAGRMLLSENQEPISKVRALLDIVYSLLAGITLNIQPRTPEYNDFEFLRNGLDCAMAGTVEATIEAIERCTLIARIFLSRLGTEYYYSLL